MRFVSVQSDKEPRRNLELVFSKSGVTCAFHRTRGHPSYPGGEGPEAAAVRRGSAALYEASRARLRRPVATSGGPDGCARAGVCVCVCVCVCVQEFAFSGLFC